MKRNKIILIIIISVFVFSNKIYSQAVTYDATNFAQNLANFVEEKSNWVLEQADRLEAIEQLREMIQYLSATVDELEKYGDTYDDVRSKMEMLENLKDIRWLDLMYQAEIILGESLNPYDYIPKSKYFYNDIGSADVVKSLDFEYANPNSSVNYMINNWFLDYDFGKFDYKTLDAAKAARANEKALSDSIEKAALRYEMNKMMRDYQLANQKVLDAREMYDMLKDEDAEIPMTKAERTLAIQKCIETIEEAEKMKVAVQRQVAAYRRGFDMKFNMAWELKAANLENTEIIKASLKKYKRPNKGVYMRRLEDMHVSTIQIVGSD
jgi:hypothetical protein